MSDSEIIHEETFMDDLRTHMINICGQCGDAVGITKIGYTVGKAYVEWFVSTTRSIPHICSTCSFFLCDKCLIELKTCPEPCNGTFEKYKIL